MSPHNDSLVISAQIMGIKVHKLLIDIGAYDNMLFKKTLDQMEEQVGDLSSNIEPCNHTILGFRDTVTPPYGMIRSAVVLESTKDEGIA